MFAKNTYLKRTTFTEVDNLCFLLPKICLSKTYKKLLDNGVQRAYIINKKWF